MEQKKEYYAFISYKREDKKEAKWLQHTLEYYRLPNQLRQHDSKLPEYVRPIFRDMTDLEVGELSAQIHSALEQSHYLIVVCSPRTVASKWVNDEIEYFISLGKQDKIIPYIIEGIPHASNPEEECYPPALLRLSKDKELLGANINEVGKDSATIRIVSRMFDIRFDTLYQRYQREQKRRRWQITIAIILAFLFLSGITGWIWHQNLLLKDRENKMVINQARAIAKNALTYINDGDLEMATALLSYIDDKTRPLFDGKCMPEIEYAFRVVYDSLLYSTTTPKRKIRNFSGSMLSASISYDDSVMVTGSTDGTVRFWNIKTGKEIEEKRIIRPTSVWAKLSPYSNHLLTIDYEDTIGIWRQEKERCILDRYITDSFLLPPSATFIDDKRFYIKDFEKVSLFYKDSILNETKWEVETFNEGNIIISKEKLVLNDYHRGKFIIYDMINNKNYNCKLRSSYNGWPHSLHFSPNGEYIIEKASGSIFIYTSSNGEFVKAFIYPEDHACNLSFGNNGNTLVVTCNDGIHFIDLIKMKEIAFKYINSDDIEDRICALSNSNNILFIGNNNKRSYDIYSTPFANEKRIHTVDTIYVKNKELFVDYDMYDGVHFGTNTIGVNDFGIVYAWWKRFRNEWEYDYKFNYCNGILKIDNTEHDFKQELNIPFIGNIWADGLQAYINCSADMFASFNLLNLEIRDKNSDIKYNLKHDSELITASFSQDSKYVITLTANQIIHIWDLENRYPYEIYNFRLDSSSYEYATMSDKNGYIYLVDFPSFDSTNRIILKRISLPKLNDIIAKLKSIYGSYKLTKDDRMLNFL